ncbi:FAD-dependent oxidoreductase [Paraburkholderia sp. 22099]|jgi:NADPH-dependent 2,4-dienoyl-CoA reductase/sulfur reductase-like enzyme|uniref:FAD-dependent oxidoreductase n=1 Tax=Paraburkholderia TaxID=1822464 RepID=UPI002863EC82|nr:FAD-dependent oxidoreductase [Paraburkholderia terricola]MDR6449714.1 NADPH-dependent 2,4-dienoyl-CoA reductase/sulfur reductase-like enzyme [Paraburkholderia terricola]MDR6495897.1 NADPH-dependent 2,4-dienoyl-CoA reductase/sulfur reductase-like enzyme [Paraburkholderia terricola]
MTQHFDIVVVGAGPAGLNAAHAAAREGVTVALLDDNPRAGGQIWRQGPGQSPQAPLQRLLADLNQRSNVTYFSSTRVIAPLGAHGLLLESAGHGGVGIRYERLILATGARERLLPFAGWTLPGVTGAGALQALIKGGMPVHGERIVIAGSGPLLIAALATARAAGARVVAVVEQASAFEVARFGASLISEPAKLRQAVGMTRGFAGLRYWTSSIVQEAHGEGCVERVTIRRGERNVTLACDRVACGYGLVPNVTLAHALGCAINEAGEIVVDGEQRSSVDGVLAAGECTGIGGAELAAVEGELAGLSASGSAASRAVLHAQRARWRRFGRRVETAFALRDAALVTPADATLLCRCEDVSLGEVRAYPDWRDAKLHTRCGMGACQGRICGAAASLYFGWQAAAPRPPFSPARIGTLMAASEEPPLAE